MANRTTETRQSDRMASRRAVRGLPLDYHARLVARMPTPMSAEATRALDDANREER